MDFIVGLPKTSKEYDSIWVIVDRLTKSAHFLPVKTIYRAQHYAELYISRILSLHGYPGLLFLTVVPSLLHASGSSYTQLSVLNSFAIQPIILRLTVKQRELIKFWKICCEPVYSLIVKSGMNVCHSQNFLTTTATWRVSK